MTTDRRSGEIVSETEDGGGAPNNGMVILIGDNNVQSLVGE